MRERLNAREKTNAEGSLKDFNQKISACGKAWRKACTSIESISKNLQQPNIASFNAVIISCKKAAVGQNLAKFAESDFHPLTFEPYLHGSILLWVKT